MLYVPFSGIEDKKEMTLYSTTARSWYTAEWTHVLIHSLPLTESQHGFFLAGRRQELILLFLVFLVGRKFLLRDKIAPSSVLDRK